MRSRSFPIIDRRRCLHWLGLGGAALAAKGFSPGKIARAEDPTESSAASLVTPATDRAVAQGLEYLARAQQFDGSFGTGGYRRNVGVVALGAMAFISGGSTPGRGKQGAQVTRSIDYLLAATGESGFIAVAEASSHGPMYGHGFATLALAEAYGMSARDDIRRKLSAAVDLIINTQNEEGGWRYRPIRRDADISVTICQVMALRAARNAGIYVPAETIDRCIEYVKRCQNPDGGFRYMLGDQPSLFPRSAAGVVALYSAGVYEGEEIDRGLAFLEKFLPKKKDRAAEGHFFYGHYYAVQAMWHAGGDRWRKWYPAIRDLLLAEQLENGSWGDAICPEYGTAMACIILQMPNNYLPIFQR